MFDPSSGTYKWKNRGSKKDKVRPLSEAHWSGAITVTQTLNDVHSSGGGCPAVANVSNLQCTGTDSDLWN